MSALDDALMATDEDPQKLALARDATHLLSVMPMLRKHMDDMDRAVENRVALKMSNGTLSDQEARDAWVEKTTIRKIIKHFEQKIRAAGLDL